MSAPPLKRRRTTTDDAKTTLSKPFRSPLKTPLHESTNSASNIPSSSPPPTNEPVITIPDISAPTAGHETSTTKPTTLNAHTIAAPPSAAAATTNVSLPALRTQHTNLLTQLSTLRSSLETSTQALRLERASASAIPAPQNPHSRETTKPMTSSDGAGGGDIKLAKLVTKWRVVARDAAEEVYAQVRERVNRMGGLRGLREMEERKRERQREWEREGMEDASRGEEGDGEVEGEADGDGERGGEEWEGEDEGEGEDGRKGGFGRGYYGEEDEGYTMGHMLRDMKIEFGVIGWDEERGRWVD